MNQIKHINIVPEEVGTLGLKAKVKQKKKTLSVKILHFKILFCFKRLDQLFNGSQSGFAFLLP